MPKQNGLFFTKQEAEKRKQEGLDAFKKKKKELYDKYHKRYSYIILNKERGALYHTIRAEISNDVKHIKCNLFLNSMYGCWLIKKKDFEKAELYVEKYKLEMKEIKYILSL